MNKFTPPWVELGMTVNWHPDPGADPIPAIVTQTGGEAISVAIIHADNIAFQPKNGVRHVSDPRNLQQQDRDSGFWSHTKFNQRVMRLLEELGGGKPKAA